MSDEQPNPVGRPVKFNSVEEMQAQIDAYFTECDEKEKPYTITGLALALDTTRKTLIHYEDKDEYFHTVKKAKTRVENFAEERLFSGAAAGPIFALKNFDWTDKVESDTTLRGDKNNPVEANLTVTFVKP